jgi:hypothetical protein
MSTITPHSAPTPILTLPTELLLQISFYVLSQPPQTGTITRGSLRKRIPSFLNRETCLDYSYVPSHNLRLLLVCRRFHRELYNLAYQMTTFTLPSHPHETISNQTDDMLQNIRKLVVECPWSQVVRWQYPFDKECLLLDELSIFRPPGRAGDQDMASFLLRLQYVKMLVLSVRHASVLEQIHRSVPTTPRDEYRKLIGQMLKLDHYERYDAPGAPDVARSWWNWSYDGEAHTIRFTAREPMPVMPEEEYLILIKPRVDEIMLNPDDQE